MGILTRRLAKGLTTGLAIWLCLLAFGAAREGASRIVADDTDKFAQLLYGHAFTFLAASLITGFAGSLLWPLRVTELGRYVHGVVTTVSLVFVVFRFEIGPLSGWSVENYLFLLFMVVVLGVITAESLSKYVVRSNRTIERDARKSGARPSL